MYLYITRYLFIYYRFARQCVIYFKNIQILLVANQFILARVCPLRNVFLKVHKYLWLLRSFNSYIYVCMFKKNRPVNTLAVGLMGLITRPSQI